MKKEGPLVLMVAAALAVVISHYITAINQTHFETSYNNWVSVTFAVAVGLGLVNMTEVHLGHLRKRRAGFGYSVGQFAGMLDGSRGAAEYESLLHYQGGATQAADGQTMAALYAVLLIVLGNLGFWAVRKGARA